MTLTIINNNNKQFIMEKNHNNQVKKVSMGIQNARKNIQSGTQITENVRGLKNNFTQLQGIIKGQSTTIESLQTFRKNMITQNTRNLQAKKYLLRIYQKTKTDMKLYFEIIKQNFSFKKGQNFEKVCQQIERLLNQQKQQPNTLTNILENILKLQILRQQIFNQFLKLMIYKKNILWRDINVPYQSYIHGQIKEILNLIKNSEEKFGFIPSTLEFITPKVKTSEGFQQITNSSLVKIVLNDFNEMIETVKNYSNLNGEAVVIEGISKNQRIVKGLRQKVQTLTENYQTLMQKYRNLQISKGRTSNIDEKSLTDRLQQSQGIINKKQQEIIEIKQGNMKLQSHITSLKQKNKQLEEQIHKWHNTQLPKIRDLESSQKSLLDQFLKIKKDLEAYNLIFENERQEKAKLYQQLKQQKDKINGLVNLLGKQKRKVKQLKQQIWRQQKINLELVDYLPDNIGKT